MRNEYSKHSSDPSVDYIAACECGKLVSVSKEAFSEPIILYYECSIADDVPGYSVESSVSIPINGEAVPLSGKCYRNCPGIAGTGESNYRAVEREGEAGLHLRYNSSMLSQVVFVYCESGILLMSSLLLT